MKKKIEIKVYYVTNNDGDKIIDSEAMREEFEGKLEDLATSREMLICVWPDDGGCNELQTGDGEYCKKHGKAGKKLKRIA